MKILFKSVLVSFLIVVNFYSQHQNENQSIINPKLYKDKSILNKSNQSINPAELDSIINVTMEQYNIPGLSALIVKYDSIVWSNNYGYANIASNRSVEDSTLFLMASISKTIMVTAIMQLWEDNLFDLEDNINDYLQPDLQVFNPYFPNDTITFKMLMTHTSSIRDNWNILLPIISCGDSPVSLDSFMVNYYTPGGIYYSQSNFFGYQPSANIWNYTNAGSSILAYLVEKLSGISFDQYCRDNIFNPLEMNETSWFLEGLDTSNIATPYEWLANQYYANCHQGWPIYPVAFLRTNKIELEHFLSAYMNGGSYNGNSILESATIDTMLQVYKYVDPYNSWGLIWFQILLNQKYLWGHTGGWSYGTSTAMYFHPEEDWGVIVFFNIDVDNNAFWYLVEVISDYASEWQIPVELISFTASVSSDYVTLNWSTSTETNNNGFEIERRQDNAIWARVGFIPGHGTTTEPKEYSYVDDISDLNSSSLAYRLKQIDFGGSFEYSDVVYLNNIAPNDFTLDQNFPNPFNPSTSIKFNLPVKSQVELFVYNSLGEEVVRLVNEVKETGRYIVEFDASTLSSGVYFYKLRAGEFIQIKKMVLVK